MLIVGGVNFFPSQLESVLLGFSETSPHYAIHLNKKGALDEVSADIEAAVDFWQEEREDIRSRMATRIEAKIKDLLGFRIKVRLVEPNSITRYEGKSKRVFDNR
jgi:phenylacetate-CoA ligase